jgi:hypothetical protein
MTQNKTTPNDQSVDQFLTTLDDEQKRTDSYRLIELMKEVTGLEPRMWGSSIIGFGRYHYRYDSGREGEMIRAGFSPRKQNLTLYNMAYFDQLEELLATLGKHTTGKGCLYIKRLSDIDLPTLKRLIEASFAYVNSKHPDAS